VELRSQLLLRVAPEQADLAGGAPPDKRAEDFSLMPASARVDKVPLGRRLDLRELGASLKLVNPNADGLVFDVMPASLDSRDLKGGSLEESGFSPGPNPNFLKPAARSVAVGADSVGEARLFLEIPDEARYRGRSWVFTVRVAPKGAEAAQAKDFRVLVTTQKEAAM
jgi:hypothetical protein